MSKDRIKSILDRVLTWPRQRQEDAAQLLLDMERDGGDSVELTDEQAAEVERRLAEPEPKFLTLEDVRARVVRSRPHRAFPAFRFAPCGLQPSRPHLPAGNP